MPVYRKAEEPYGCGWVGRASLPTLEHYVDNNSTPTVASNLLKANAMLSWHVSCQRAKCFKPLLCATIGRPPSVMRDNACYGNPVMFKLTHKPECKRHVDCQV
jgi:hypothetical protein